MKDLKSISKKELQEFLNSFDRILSDIDGVLWLYLETIPGTQDAIRCLKQLGKEVMFVSNNTTKSLDFYHDQLKTAGFDVEKHELITPIVAMISHLKKLNVTKEIYVIGMEALKTALKNAGFKVAEDAPSRIPETFNDFLFYSITDNEEVGAVIADGDINVNYAMLQKAATYLKRPEVVFITGITDKKIPLGSKHVLLGPGYFHEIIQETTGRTPYALAKPSIHFNEFLVENFQIKDRSRVLFVGDSVAEDMGFADKCGYKKLLVLSGLTKKEALKPWTFPEAYKPEYYVDSLKTLHDLILTHGLNASLDL